MKKNILKKSNIFCLSMFLMLFLNLLISVGNNVYADDNIVNNQSNQFVDESYNDLSNKGAMIPTGVKNIDYKKFEPYIFIENNQYVLKLPTVNSFTSTEISDVNKQLKFSNDLILENNANLNKETGEALITIPNNGQLSLYRSAGSTYVKVHWNYINVGISRDLLKVGITASVTGIAGGLASYYSFGTVTTFVTRVVSSLVGYWVASKIHSGIWFHLNYAFGVTNYGWQ